MLCITTNSDLTKDSKAVMGKGCALQAKERYPGIDTILGVHIKNKGNIPCLLYYELGTFICSFPTKHSWKYPSDLSLIEQSTEILVQLANEYGFNKIALPKPGCSNGGLKWPAVRKVLSNIIGNDNRFIIVDVKDEQKDNL